MFFHCHITSPMYFYPFGNRFSIIWNVASFEPALLFSTAEKRNDQFNRLWLPPGILWCMQILDKSLYNTKYTNQRRQTLCCNFSTANNGNWGYTWELYLLVIEVHMPYMTIIVHYIVTTNQQPTSIHKAWLCYYCIICKLPSLSPVFPNFMANGAVFLG